LGLDDRDESPAYSSYLVLGRYLNEEVW